METLQLHKCDSQIAIKKFSMEISNFFSTILKK